MESTLPKTVSTNESQEIPLPPELQKLSVLLEESPETLASGNSKIQTVALNAAKHIFDLSVQSEASSRPHVVELISSLTPSLAPQTRSKLKAQAEKSSSQNTQKDLFAFTPLTSLFTDGVDQEQVWAQLDLRTQTICRMLDFVLEGESGEPGEGVEEQESSDDDGGHLRQALEALEGDGDVDMDEFLAKYGLDEDDELEKSEDEDEELDNFDAGSDSEEDGDESEEEEDVSPLRDPSSDEESDTDKPGSGLPNSILKKSSKKRKRTGPSELDDGFFNLAEFNADTERAEAKSSSRGRLAGDDSDDEEMGVDLSAPVDPAEDLDEDDLENDTRELFYRDFFEPPARMSSASSPNKNKAKTAAPKNQVRFHEEVRVKKIKPTGKNRSLHDDRDEEDEDEDDVVGDLDEAEELDDEEEQDWGLDTGEVNSDEDSDGFENTQNMNPTIERLKNDLFADEEEDTQDDRTTYEKRMAALREQITELESENVAVKDWTLMGEAGSRQRPQNSLLEEDLEFDRVMKAVPVITEEAVQTLEETIKARILEGRFDDVVRIRPLEDKPFLPSKFFELQDAKSTQSLAQIYENEYVATQAGGALPEDRDGKLKKEHDEITLLWENICGKLDALCNAHFIPKQPKATISTVTNTATATLESALPTSKSTTTMLAPEEVFSSSPSSLRSRSELTPAEKRALRTKERKVKKRQRDALEKSVDKFAKAKGISGVKKQKQAALDSIVKHGKGVTVVGKKGIPNSDDKRKKSKHVA